MPKLNIHKLGEAIVLRCSGGIVFGECHILRHAVFSHPYIAIAVLDMTEVTAMDAAGLGLLVELRNWAYAKRIQLKLLNLTPRVANLLNRTHLMSMFDVCLVRDVIDLLFRANESSLAGIRSTTVSGYCERFWQARLLGPTPFCESGMRGKPVDLHVDVKALRNSTLDNLV